MWKWQWAAAILPALAVIWPCTLKAEEEMPKTEQELAPGLYAKIATRRGEMIAWLEYRKTPLTVMNFAGLAEGKIEHSRKGHPRYYDGLKFHRVIKGFMIQGGDPTGTGGGGPGHSIADEFDFSLRHDAPGLLSMANRGVDQGKYTNGSQFFITHGATPHLDDRHTIFGRLVSGLDVARAVQQDDKMDKVEIFAIGEAAQEFLDGITQKTFDDLKTKKERAPIQDKAYVEKSLDQAAVFMKKSNAERYLKLRAQVLERDSAPTPEACLQFITDAQARLAGASVSSNGLMYAVLKKGEGEAPKRGQKVKAHYTGYFLNGEIFDSSRERREAFEVAAGAGQVIPGWDVALLEMLPGERRLLFLPYRLAYGANGTMNPATRSPGPIPPYTMIVFDMEVVP